MGIRKEYRATLQTLQTLQSDCAEADLTGRQLGPMDTKVWFTVNDQKPEWIHQKRSKSAFKTVYRRFTWKG
jgi:hypothetical protein